MKSTVLVVFLVFLGCEAWTAPDGITVDADTARVETHLFYIPSRVPSVDDLLRALDEPSLEQRKWLLEHNFECQYFEENKTISDSLGGGKEPHEPHLLAGWWVCYR